MDRRKNQKNKVSERQKRFASAYIRLGSAPKAVLEAGFSEKAHHRTAYRLLSEPKVRREIARQLEEIRQKEILDAGAVLHQLSQMATADPAEMFDEEGQFKHIVDMPKPLRLAIKEFKFHPERGATVKFESRLKALDLLGKNLQLWADVNVNNFFIGEEKVQVNINFGAPPRDTGKELPVGNQHK